MPIQSQAQYEALPPHMKKYYDMMALKAEAIEKEPFSKYEADRIAPIPEDIRVAHRMVRDGLGGERGQLIEAAESTRRGRTPFHQRRPGGGTMLDEYMNPYQQHVVRQIAEEGNRNFNENILPALEAKFVKLGRFGGSRHTELARRAARDLQHEILSRQQQALASGYQQAGQFYNAQQARELEASNQLANLAAARQGARLADVAALENQGRYQQQQQQAAHDFRYQEFLRNLEHPMQRLAYQASILQGLPTQGINQSYYQTPATPQMNVMGALGPLAAQIWATRMMGGRS